MTHQRSRKKLRAASAPPHVIESLTDLDHARLEQHGDWRVPNGIRRLQRFFIHDRLFAAGRITPAEWQAASDYGDDYARAQGAVDGGATLDRVDGSGAGGPTDAVVAAVSRRRRAHERIGREYGVLLDAACGEGWSVMALAVAFAGGNGGAAQERVHRMVAIALEMLVVGDQK